ncbi:uroporphyrinogen-III C-methyltransferase [Fulvivirgaceae bacterium PWU4]|uniref:uroporphyrinogen-III C-methyltransferase n=1 Tax=Chryseosolibacter histidini TaxID=2782349 RepID=A0AAP2DRN4_9BACT|nr:uroporphyrinogen-III C-methyltransferase [Chryseosolibacter histidini]MBT1701240.1 uroporphyrinogen-III C-methyltransferase [Chryseosolibacter histidini]
MTTIFSFHKEPRLTLVGAGPGDPELITLKAINTLKAADIVLYDALVSEEILAYIPVGTPALSVGKRAGEHSYTQDEINELIVEFAYLYGHVVRLKGGDPFVFGRGAEEIEFAARHGVTTSVVPGISSAIAVPAAMNIPVTSRGVSESFWVVTGTTMAGAISDDVALAARSTATVVILMGLNKLEEIMTIFSANGKEQTPVAVVQNGTLKDQRSVTGTVSTIVERARQEKIGAPAIIVVGEVVRFSAFVETLASRMQGQVSAFQ